ncbi:MAG TPA: single-stranded-DNA-specific exonuclease RecJ [Thermoanaerobaculia bacterium]|nr:single-stranded-DNA-specific exonuclease RecJ [Thermoanaerobaculia bacterium]
MPTYDEWILRVDEERSPEFPLESPLIRSILRRRGVVCHESFRRFVSPSIDDLHDGASIHGMEVACERIFRAIRDRENILIYGDYDVDGVTSIVLLTTVLSRLGADVGYVIPHRLADGYGLKSEVLARVEKERQIKLVITVDCGITSVEPVLSAIERGIDVIITDHHLPPGNLPAAAAVLNPRQPGCSYPFKDLAGAGVALKLCAELLRRSGSSMSLLSLMKIAALGTVADVAPLIGENRTIVSLGLKGLSHSTNFGLSALLRTVGLEGHGVRASDVGFKLGPRINAAGRLASADTAIQLFGAKDEAVANQLVDELNRLNRERQSIEKDVRRDAEEQIATSGVGNILVLSSETWHRGVLGLSAGRLAQKYNRPVLMIAVEGETCSGSARSISSINLHGALEKVAHLFTHFGGHEFACGFSLPVSNLAPLKTLLRAHFSSHDIAAFRRTAWIEGELTPRALTRSFMKEHQSLEPFGAGNPQPLFLMRGLRVSGRREFSEGCHEVMLARDDRSVPAVIWPSQTELLPLFDSGCELDLVAQLQPTRYSQAGVRLELVDAARSGEMIVRNETGRQAVSF